MLARNSDLGIKQEFILQPYSYNELEQATNRFQEELEEVVLVQFTKELCVKVTRLLQLSN